jgi:hypothetical protein
MGCWSDSVEAVADIFYEDMTTDMGKNSMGTIENNEYHRLRLY